MVQAVKDSWKEYKESDLLTKCLVTWFALACVSAVVTIIRIIFGE